MSESVCVPRAKIIISDHLLIHMLLHLQALMYQPQALTSAICMAICAV